VSSDDAWLQDMVSAAREAIERTAGFDRARSLADRDKQLAVQHLLVLPGEAAAQVSASTRAQLPAVPWRDIVAMRNRLVHRYFNVRLDLVWQVVETDLPGLADELARAVPADAAGNSEHPAGT
jgi:uncharacterized protein with HEPN domain